MIRKIWWLNPAIVYVFLYLLVWLAFFLPESTYMSLYSASKIIDLKYILIHTVSVIFFLIGFFISKKIIIKSEFLKTFEVDETTIISKLKKAYIIIWIICICSYTLWYTNFIVLNGIGILKNFLSLDGISGAMYLMRENSGKLSGITTFTELGIPIVSLGTYLYFKIQDRKAKRNILLTLLFLYFCALFRSVAFSERLAVLELLIPTFVVYISFKVVYRKLFYQAFPIFLFFIMIFVFGVFEYSRSWSRFYIYYYDSYIDFILQRLMGYYCNAINTECLCLEYGSIPYLPFRSLIWFWILPGMSDIFLCLTNVDVLGNFSYILSSYANPEYNSPGGLLTFYTDFGSFFIIFQLLFGYVIGKTYYSYVRGEFFGILLYSFFYFTILELPRHFLLGLSKTLVVYVGWLLIWFSIKIKIKI